jgi:hypothetical protein
MKKIALLFIPLLFLICNLASAQPYTFSHFTSPYVPLTGGTSIKDSVIHGVGQNVPIGFPFSYLGRTHTVVTPDPNGFLDFGDADTAFYFVGIWYDQYTENGSGDILYLTEGPPGNQIFKIEYKNLYPTDDSSESNTTNFQIWLYQADSSLEVRAGPRSVSMEYFYLHYFGMDGPFVGIAQEVLAGGTYPYTFMLEGMPSMPTTSFTPFVNLAGVPSNGQVYRFGPSLLHRQNTLSEPTWTVGPNPTSGQLTLTKQFSSTSTFHLMNMLGVEMESLDAPAGIGSLHWDLGHLPNGMYMIRAEGKAIPVLVQH